MAHQPHPSHDTPPDTDDARWDAIVHRDASLAAPFVYGVRTTGIYCVPSCPSRRPRRENVRFFADATAAHAAGFRECKRCGDPDASVGARGVERARAWLDTHPGERTPLDTLARIAGVSPFHLQRTFKRITGLTPRQYEAALRADRMKHELRTGSTVSRATTAAGYGAVNRGYDAARDTMGMTPATYRRGGRGTSIHYTLSRTPLGHILIAATHTGVCAITLGDTREELVAALESEFPHAERTFDETGSNEALADWTRTVVAYLNGETTSANVPTDTQGTELQQRVWSELQRIPPGETRSYSEIAEAVGAPRAVRAVANACASNRIALVIPCHRAVRRSGTFGGYRWGLERKRAILERERDEKAAREPIGIVVTRA